MPTGTDGPDVFNYFGGTDPISARGGDDTINVTGSYDGPSRSPMSVAIWGDEGFDTLNMTARYTRDLRPDYIWATDFATGPGVFFDYRSIERLYVSTTFAPSGPFHSSGNWTTGDTTDEIHVATVDGDRIDVFTGGGNDKIYLGTVGSLSSGHGGSGNDLVDLSGVLASGTSAFGDDGDDILVGSAQADMLDGGLGADAMSGGAGDDVYVVDNVADTVTEAPGGGSDTVRTALAAYLLAAEVEKLTATDAGPHYFTLNAGDNLVTGNEGADFLRLQQGGADTALGLGGNDVFYFGGALTAADAVAGGGGTDTLILQGDYSGGLALTGNIAGIEGLSMLAGSNTNFGDPGTNRYDYVITTNDANFAAGLQVRINGAALLAGEDFTFNGSAETDAKFVVYGGRGVDTLTGGLGNDIFFFAEDRFASGNTVNGGSGYDGMFLRGNYMIDFNAPGYSGSFTGIENLTVGSATDERYARGGTEFDYDIVWADILLGAGGSITVSGVLLQANETMNFDGSAETDGSFRIFAGAGEDQLYGGSGADLILGGLGADTMRGGAGNDVFRFDSAADSTSAARDTVEDFASGDKIDLSRIDADTSQAGDQVFSFIGTSGFSHQAGELRVEQVDGTNWLVRGDTDGDGDSDFVLLLVVTDSHPLAGGDFIL
ncbi:MAG: hypothetical protein QOJ91_1834 [Sphingomonadales bacterium]|jgi:Ca2+-binding RTX toxin-like protein|nr:hypothetical protein [Sphingomonadales bacterium]